MDQTESPLRFARHNFENLQFLIRFADAKAGALTGFVFILVGTGSGLFLKGVEKFHFFGSYWREVIGFLFCVSWAAFLIIVVLKLLFLVVLPRSAKHYSEVDHTHHLIIGGILRYAPTTRLLLWRWQRSAPLLSLGI
jgi:hypothetical protein